MFAACLGGEMESTEGVLQQDRTYAVDKNPRVRGSSSDRAVCFENNDFFAHHGVKGRQSMAGCGAKHHETSRSAFFNRGSGGQHFSKPISPLLERLRTRLFSNKPVLLKKAHSPHTRWMVSIGRNAPIKALDRRGVSDLHVRCDPRPRSPCGSAQRRCIGRQDAASVRV